MFCTYLFTVTIYILPMNTKDTISSLSTDPVYKVTYGGWYQRTTLHLSELYEFFANGNSYLKLDKAKLAQYRNAIEISSVTRELGYLEYVELHTKSGVTVKYYEDGLYLLSIETADVPQSREMLDNFYTQKLSPAVSYLFSLGAPTPKVLANIKTHHPTVVTTTDDTVPSWLTGVYSSITANGITVSKSPEYIYIKTDGTLGPTTSDLVDMQIFFREFKDQLERYLNIHRTIWEEIERIREANTVKIKDIESIRSKLDSYQKTVSLITNRINQMGSYARTRKAIAQNVGIDQHMVSLFQYRFEVLLDTLDYIKEIWKMTSDYVASAIQILVDANTAANTKSIQSLTMITSVGVIAGLIVHVSREAYPKFTLIGVSYLVGLFVAGWLLNFLVQRFTQNKKQVLKFKSVTKDL